jgi:hypothetical protein
MSNVNKSKTAKNTKTENNSLKFIPMFDSKWIKIDRGKSISIKHGIDIEDFHSSDFIISTLNKTEKGVYKHDYCTKLEWNWEFSENELKIRRLKNDNKFYKNRKKDEFRLLLIKLM